MSKDQISKRRIEHGNDCRGFEFVISNLIRISNLEFRISNQFGAYMKWWPLFGLGKRLTERTRYSTELSVGPVAQIFRKSLHIYPIDVGNANDLNFDIRALQAPQYNIHRYGIFFADVPRHADVLLVLGKPTEKMIPVLMETVNQMPAPYSIVSIERGEDTRLNGNHTGIDIGTLGLSNIAARITNYREPKDIIAVLLKLMGKAN